jgi:hypothetical protein
MESAGPPYDPALGPGISTGMELLRDVVASAAQQLWLQMLQRKIDPLAAGHFHPLLAGSAPGIRPRIAGLVSREETHPLVAA